MKVVIPVGDLHIGGGCKLLVETAHALQNYGHDVELVMPQTGSVKYELACQLKRAPSLSKENIPGGDIVLPNFYSTFQPAYEAWAEQCIRFSMGFEPYWVPDQSAALWTYQQPVPIISISRWLDRQIFQHVHKRTRVVNPGVDRRFFHPSPEAGEAKKRGEPAVILYIARDPKSGYALKGFDDFAASLNILQQSFRDGFVVHLICPEAPLSLSGIPYRVSSPKSEGEMAELYRSADLFVSSSWFEAFSFPPLEAMACGTPVVTTNSGGVLDYCVHRKNSLICKPRDPHSLAAAMLRVLADQSLQNQMVQGGLETAKRFTKEAFERQMVATLVEIHRQRSRWP